VCAGLALCGQGEHRRYVVALSKEEPRRASAGSLTGPPDDQNDYVLADSVRSSQPPKE
jgi:hypothetical protein